ncbi:MAG: DNA polymerase III subunit delta' [Candidatus Ancillula sp.]|nr:DNA polymerase III subunit delta' [Candidatus Ancillula sp.]
MSIWDKLVGQKEVVEELRQYAINRERLANSWLFTGAPGSGRSVAAELFAQTLLCEVSGGKGEPCGECEQCRMVEARTHPDVMFVKTNQKQYKVDDIRSKVMPIANLTPKIGKYRIIYIEDADRLRQESQNSLLKYFEEPEPLTIWILSCPNRGDVLPTIQSRARIVNLKIPSDLDVEMSLKQDGIEQKKAQDVSRLAAGHIGLAKLWANDEEQLKLRLRNSAIALGVHKTVDAVLFAEEVDKEADRLAEEKVQAEIKKDELLLRKELGLGENDKISKEFQSFFKSPNKDDLKRMINRSKQDYIDIILQEILMVYRDITLIQSQGKEELVYNQFDLDLIKKYSLALTKKEVEMRIEKIEEARKRILTNASLKLILESMFCSLLLPTRVLS